MKQNPITLFSIEGGRNKSYTGRLRLLSSASNAQTFQCDEGVAE